MNLALEIQLHASVGKGWEDIYVILLKKGLVRPEDRNTLRRYVLGLSSKIVQRYGS